MIDRLAAQGGQVEGRAVEGRPDDGRRRLADGRLRPAADRAGDEHDDHGRDQGDGEREQDRTTWRGGPAYWSVAVPVMFEWIVQTNVYVPAGSDGTS